MRWIAFAARTDAIPLGTSHRGARMRVRQRKCPTLRRASASARFPLLPVSSRSMLRRVFTILSALSLLLCGATVTLWVRSYWTAAHRDTNRFGTPIEFSSEAGVFRVTNDPEVQTAMRQRMNYDWHRLYLNANLATAIGAGPGTSADTKTTSAHYKAWIKEATDHHDAEIQKLGPAPVVPPHLVLFHSSRHPGDRVFPPAADLADPLASSPPPTLARWLLQDLRLRSPRHIQPLPRVRRVF